MKKFTFFLLTLVSTSTVFAQTFKRGDMVADLTIGVGSAQVSAQHYNDNKELISEKQAKPTFTQKLGFEVGIWDITENSALGFGVNINNACGAAHNSYVTGTYDYTYYSTSYTKNNGRWQTSNHQEHKRSGSGNAIAKTTIDDFNVMFKLAYHHQLIDNLDTYFALGFGVDSRRNFYGSYSETTGFSAARQEYDSNHSGSFQLTYSYDDLDHVEWQNSTSFPAFCMAAYIGARYYLTENWGITCELGLTSLSIKKDLNDFSIFNLGACYKF